MSEQVGYDVSTMLLVLGDDLDPDHVTRLLGIFPDRAWRRGEHNSFRDARGETRYLESVAAWGGWKKFVPDEVRNKSLEMQMYHWCSVLETKSERIAELVASGQSVAIDCYMQVFGDDLIEFSAPLVREIATLGVDVDVHLVRSDPDSA
jgi:hypothetical protein